MQQAGISLSPETLRSLRVFPSSSSRNPVGNSKSLRQWTMLPRRSLILVSSCPRPSNREQQSGRLRWRLYDLSPQSYRHPYLRPDLSPVGLNPLPTTVMALDPDGSHPRPKQQAGEPRHVLRFPGYRRRWCKGSLPLNQHLFL